MVGQFGGCSSCNFLGTTLVRFFIFVSLLGEFSIRGNGGVLSMARIKTSRVCNSVSGVRALHCFN